MNVWENATLTNKGIALMAKTLTGNAVHITRAAIGSGKVAAASLVSLTGLISEVMNVTINPLIPENQIVTIPVVLNNDRVNVAFDLWQVGLYANDPDEGEILFFVAQSETAFHVPTAVENAGYTMEWHFALALSNDLQINATVNPAGYITVATADYRYLKYGGTVDGGLFVEEQLEPTIVGTFDVGEKYVGAGNVPKVASQAASLQAEPRGIGTGTQWVNYVTPVDEDNMNKIEETLEKKVDEGNIRLVADEF